MLLVALYALREPRLACYIPGGTDLHSFSFGATEVVSLQTEQSVTSSPLFDVL